MIPNKGKIYFSGDVPTAKHSKVESTFLWSVEVGNTDTKKGRYFKLSVTETIANPSTVLAITGWHTIGDWMNTERIPFTTGGFLQIFTLNTKSLPWSPSTLLWWTSGKLNTKKHIKEVTTLENYLESLVFFFFFSVFWFSEYH